MPQYGEKSNHSPLDTAGAAGLSTLVKPHQLMAITMLNNWAVSPTFVSARFLPPRLLCSWCVPRIGSWLCLLALATGMLFHGTSGASAPTNTTVQAPDQTAEERAACIKNLKTIYDAIQEYQRDHKSLPNWLSDLVPQYLADVNVLTCPVCRRTGLGALETNQGIASVLAFRAETAAP